MKLLGWATAAWFAYWVGFCVGRELSHPAPVEPVASIASHPEWWTTKTLAAGRN